METRATATAKAALFSLLGLTLFLVVQFAAGTMIALGAVILAVLSTVFLSYR